jgi:hypothetical protein
VTDARDVRPVTIFLRPFDGVMLRCEGGDRVVGMAFDDKSSIGLPFFEIIGLPSHV